MADAEQEIPGLVVRARAGDEEAIRILVEDWGEALRRVIRRQLAKEARAVRGPEDIAQSVLKSFFAHIIHERPELTDEQMLRCLGIVARNKAVETNRQCRGRASAGPRRVESLDGPDAPPEEALVTREPSPDKDAMSQEAWERLLAGKPEHARTILNHLRQGCTHAEVAARMGIGERSVRRVVERAWRCHRVCSDGQACAPG